MRKLTVKNFSVIKDAELEFGKITVLIGPQASGKSLLCKLAYFFNTEVVNIAVGRVMNEFDFPAFESATKKSFVKWFPVSGWGAKDWSITLVLDTYSVSVSTSKNSDKDIYGLTLKFSQAFINLYEKCFDEFAQDTHRRPKIEHFLYLEFYHLMGRETWDDAIYIPSERSFFVDIQKGYGILASQPDPLLKRFSELYARSLSPEIPKPQLKSQLKGELRRGEDSWQFIFDDGRILPLSHLSSGSKQLLALLPVLEMHAHLHQSTTDPRPAFHDEFFIEEPEADVFPATQFELVHYFAELANDKLLRPTLTITTHSPYILSAFNNLIEAGQLAKAKPELKDKVAKLIPEQYWIKEGDFKAYAIENEVLKSIVAEDTGLVSTNYLDQVSETIGMEFDELLRLGYAES